MSAPYLTRRGALAASTAAALAACVPAPRRDRKQLVVSVASDITTLDPATTFLLPNLMAPHVCYDRLLRLKYADGVTTGVEGDLAEAWELARDKSTLTFHLRGDARYDDGTDVSASDFIFAIERIFKRKFPAAQALFWYDGAEAPDVRTLRIKLSAYAPFVPYLLTSPGLGFVNPAIVRHAQDDDLGSSWLRENTAGSGPYRVAGFSAREEVRLAPNPHSRQPPAFFTDVRLRTSKDSTIRLIELEKGDVDFVEGVGPFQQDWLSRRANVTVASGPAPIVLFLQLNTERPLFRDIRVREAISLAIDRDLIARSVFRSQARTIGGVLPPGVPGYDSSLPPPRYDLAEARRLMREAGVKPGQTVELTVVGDGGGPSATQLAIRESLQAIGLDVAIKQIALSARSQIFKGDFDMTTQSISVDFPDPWIVFTFVYSSQMIGSGNMSRYANPNLDAVLARADALDGEARLALYKQAQRIVVADLPAIPLLQTSWGYAQSRDIAQLDYNFSTPMMLPIAGMRRSTL